MITTTTTLTGDGLLSFREVHALIGSTCKTSHTARALAARGQLKAVRFNERTVKYTRASVLELIAGKAPVVSPPPRLRCTTAVVTEPVTTAVTEIVGTDSTEFNAVVAYAKAARALELARARKDLPAEMHRRLIEEAKRTADAALANCKSLEAQSA